MRPIRIDIDVWESAADYVDKQVAVMRKYGAGPVPEWDDEMRANTIYEVACHPQKLRNLVKKSKRMTPSSTKEKIG